MPSRNTIAVVTAALRFHSLLERRFNMSLHSLRRGFSLVELLLVLAIAALLVGLLVPAAHALQQFAHKQATLNNLKHICLAIHNANDSYKRLPPA